MKNFHETHLVFPAFANTATVTAAANGLTVLTSQGQVATFITTHTLLATTETATFVIQQSADNSTFTTVNDPSTGAAASTTLVASSAAVNMMSIPFSALLETSKYIRLSVSAVGGSASFDLAAVCVISGIQSHPTSTTDLMFSKFVSYV